MGITVFGVLKALACAMKYAAAVSLMTGLALAGGPVHASPLNHSLAGAQNLLASCQTDAPTLRAMCLGYLAAIADDIARHQKDGTATMTVCPPALVNLDDYRRAFVALSASTPAILAGPSFEAVKASLQAQWPCPQ